MGRTARGPGEWTRASCRPTTAPPPTSPSTTAPNEFAPSRAMRWRCIATPNARCSPNGLTLLVRRDRHGARGGDRHAREGRLLRRDRRHRRHRACARAHVLQGHADARRRARSRARPRPTAAISTRTRSTTTPATTPCCRRRRSCRGSTSSSMRTRDSRDRRATNWRANSKSSFRKPSASATRRRRSPSRRCTRCCTTGIASAAGASASEAGLRTLTRDQLLASIAHWYHARRTRFSPSSATSIRTRCGARSRRATAR